MSEIGPVKSGEILSKAREYFEKRKHIQTKSFKKTMVETFMAGYIKALQDLRDIERDRAAVTYER